MDDTAINTRQPRGIRNCNPGNIRLGEKWNGLREEQTDGEFCQFVEPVMGLRAMAKVLLTYQRKHGLWTIAEMVGRWAPPSENDTRRYAVYVAKAIDAQPEWEISLEHNPVDFRRMIAAMVKMENGVQPYDDDMLDRAIVMALE